MSKTGFYKGRLGIGLTSTMGMGDGNPRYPLDINGDIRLTGAIVNSQGLALNMVNPDSAWVVDAANNKISYSAGNVGIGTTDPQAPLHIVDKDSIGSASEVLRLQRGESTGDINTSSKGSIGMYLEDSNNGGGEVAKIEWRHDGTNSSAEGLGTLSFWTSNTGAVDGVPEERMTIRASGNVGIGTTSPYSNLHINKGTGSAVWNTNFKPSDCHLYLGGYEWGVVGTTLKFGFGYMDRSDGNIPCYMGARVEGTSVDGEYAIVFGTRNSNVDTVVPEDIFASIVILYLTPSTHPPSGKAFVIS